MKKDFSQKHLTNILLIIAVTLMLLVLISVSSTAKEINHLMGRLSFIESKMNNLEYNISSTVSNSLTDIEDTINKEVSIVTESSYKLGEIKNGLVPIEIKATPKTFNEGLKARFIIEGDDATRTEIEADYDGVQFVASLQIPLHDRAELLLQLDDNGTIITTKLMDFSPISEVMLEIEPNFISNSSSIDSDGNVRISDYFLNVDVHEGKASKAEVEMCDVVTFLNDKEIGRNTLEETSTGEYSYKYSKTMQVKDGDNISIVVMVKDSNGLLYKFPVDSWDIIESGGGFDFNHSEEAKAYEYIAEYVG